MSNGRTSNDKLEHYYTEEDDQLSLIRPDWFADFLIRNLNIEELKNSNPKILDVGCGNGKLLYHLKKAGLTNVYGCDYSVDSKEKSDFMQGFKTIDLNTQSLSDMYAKESFDLVCCTETLEHLFDPGKNLTELITITKRKGHVFITLPLDLNILARIRYLFGHNVHNPFTVGTHIKFFKPHDVIGKLREYDLEIIKLKYLGLGYGLLDQKLPYISPVLAHMLPSLFSADMMILARKR